MPGARPAIPVSASLTAQSRRAASASCAARLGLMGRRLAKYSPEIPATSGALVSHTAVSAPLAGESSSGAASRRCRMTGWRAGDTAAS